MSDLDVLKNLLFTTYKGTSNEEIKKAEQELLKVASHPDFLQYLLEIMKDTSIDNHLRQSASVYVQTFVRKTIKSPNISPEKRKNIIELIVLMMREENVSVNAKQNIAKGLNIALCFDDKGEIIMKILFLLIIPRKFKKANTTKMLLFELIRNWILSDTSNNQLIATFIILQTVIVSVSNKDFLLNFFNLLNLPFCQIGSKYLGQISASLQNISSLSENEAIQVYATTIESLKVLNMWAIVLKDLINSVMDSKKPNLIGIILENEVLASLICHGICVTLSTPQQISDCLICTSGKEEFDLEANLLKSNLLKSYTRVNRQLFNERSKYDTQKTPFFKLLTQSLPIVLKGLICFCQQTPNFQDKLDDLSLAAIVIECLKFTTICAEQSEFYSIFQECSRVLLLEVIFPLLRTSASEEQSLISDPEEFVKLALDTCDRQLIYSYKTAAAKLLETVCDYIDGFETIVSISLLQIIAFSISCDKVDDIDVHFPNLANQKNTIFIMKTERHIRIETCLVSLSILSYLTPKRPDIVFQIENLLRTNQEFFFSNTLSKLIKARVCLMLGYYADSVFQRDITSYKQMLGFLISCVRLDNQEDQGIVVQSMDSLLVIYQDDTQKQLVVESINSILQELIPLITAIDFVKFFDILLQIFKGYSSAISKENIFLSLRELTKRVIDETKLIEQKMRPDRSFVDKSWHIIRQMTESPYIIPGYINEVLIELKPLLQCLQFPDKIDFDEEIVVLVRQFVSMTGDIHPICGDLLTCFPLLLKKQKDTFREIFNTLNKMIIYGKAFFTQNESHLKLIIEMSHQVMSTNDAYSTDADKAEGAMILQLVFQNLGEIITEEMWKAILNSTIEQFAPTRKLRHYFIYGRLAGVFLSGFYQNVEKTQQVLHEGSFLDTVLDKILIKHEFFKRNYDIKLFILSMSKVIINMSLQPQRVLKIFETLITLLKKQKELEMAAQIKKQKKLEENQKDEDYDDEFDDDDDDDNEDDQEEEDIFYPDDSEEEDEYEENSDNSVSVDKYMLRGLVSNINLLDEFSAFKQSLLTMKTQNSQALQHLVESLSQDQQNYLKELLSIQRIVIGEEQVVRVIRTVKKKAPANQQ